jgi:hypothetical protein
MYELKVRNMPTLLKISVSKIPVDFTIDQSGSPNAYLSTECN